MKYCPLERRERVPLAEECVYTPRVFFVVVRRSEWSPWILKPPIRIVRTFARWCQKASSPALGGQPHIWGPSAVALDREGSLAKPNYGLRGSKSLEVGVARSGQT